MGDGAPSAPCSHSAADGGLPDRGLAADVAPRRGDGRHRDKRRRHRSVRTAARAGDQSAYRLLVRRLAATRRLRAGHLLRDRSHGRRAGHTWGGADDGGAGLFVALLRDGARPVPRDHADLPRRYGRLQPDGRPVRHVRVLRAPERGRFLPHGVRDRGDRPAPGRPHLHTHREHRRRAYRERHRVVIRAHQRPQSGPDRTRAGGPCARQSGHCRLRPAYGRVLHQGRRRALPFLAPRRGDGRAQPGLCHLLGCAGRPGYLRRGTRLLDHLRRNTGSACGGGAGHSGRGQRPDGPGGAAFYILTHAPVKAALFLCVGILWRRFDSVDEHHLRGRGRDMVGTGLLFALGGLSLAGLPPLTMFLGKGLIEDSANAVGYPWVTAVLVLASILTGGAVLRAAGSVFLGWGVDDTGHPCPPETDRYSGRVPVVVFAPPCVLMVGALILSAIPQMGPVIAVAAARFQDRAAYAALVLDGVT